MTAHQCRNCDRPALRALCSNCLAGLADALRAVPQLLEHLHDALAKQDHLGEPGRHQGKLAAAPLPVRLDMTRVIDALAGDITSQATELGLDTSSAPRRRPHNSKPQLGEPLGRGEFGRGAGSAVFPASSPSVDLACYAAVWLAEHVEVLAEYHAPLKVHRAITGAIARAQEAIDRPPAQLYIGNCDFCETPLYAVRGASGTHCERCRVYFADVADRWDRALRKLRGYPVTAAAFAGHVGQLYGVTVDRKRINLWHHRGDIRRVDTDPETGAPRFRIGQLLDRAARYKPRKAG